MKEVLEGLDEWHRGEAGGWGVLEARELDNLRADERAAAEASFRWGEPQVEWEDGEHLRVAIALSCNQRMTGAVLWRAVALGEDEASHARKAGRLALALMDWLGGKNVLNQALMEARRGRGLRERAQAEAIHEWKRENTRELRRGFLHYQPELLLAIRRGDRAEARRVLNLLLLRLFNAGRGDFDQVRQLVSELVALMRASARDCGVDPERHPELAAPIWETLARMDDEEELSPWIHRELESLIAMIEAAGRRPGLLRARLVLEYMLRNFRRPLGRAEVAAKAGLSEAELSRMLRRETGSTFVEHLQRLRVDEACRLLRESSMTVQEVALQCGFEEAPYFCRVFKRVTGRTAGGYRKAISSHGTSFRLPAEGSPDRWRA